MSGAVFGSADDEPRRLAPGPLADQPRKPLSAQTTGWAQYLETDYPMPRWGAFLAVGCARS